MYGILILGTDELAERRAAHRRRWRAEGWYPELTLGEAFARAARDRPATRLVFATRDSEDVVALAELHGRARRMASGLIEAGVRPGDPVVVQLPATAASTALVQALWLAGAVLVPVVAFASEAELRAIVERSGARRTAADFDLGELERSAPLERLPPVDRTEAACVIYTSGSTAEPKGVRHSHETLLVGLGPAPEGDVSLMTFPAGHIASVLGLVRPLTSGADTVVMDRWSPRRAVELIEAHGVTSSAGTPFYLATLLDEAERSGRDISTLARFLVGAASVPPALVERAEAAGIVSWRTYGSTEHPAISSGVPDDPVERRTRTDGRVGPGNEVRITDESGADVPLGEEGEILARGPRQLLGYDDPALDLEAFVGASWLRTGDVGRLDGEGYLTITDRKKDVIIRGGENISAREVEDALAAHPAVGEVAVCAGPDEVWGERVCAFVIPRHGLEPSLDDLRAHLLSAGLAAHKAPERLDLVDDLPRTAAGKVRKADLRARLASVEQP